MNEAETVFTQMLGCDRLALYQNRFSCLGKKEMSQVSRVLRRRLRGEPLAYVLGKIEFMGLEFQVNNHVLIPRPETEILVETVLRYAAQGQAQAAPLKIMDLGTGSGCISVSLAHFLKGACILATDISREALVVASRNARDLGAQDRIQFVCSDLFQSFQFAGTGCDLIVSNPPYVASGEINGLQPEIRFEPRVALDGGGDGLDFFRKIISQAPNHLKEGGLCILEMGWGQAPALEQMLEDSTDLKLSEIIQDYSRIDRVLVARKARKNG